MYLTLEPEATYLNAVFLIHTHELPHSVFHYFIEESTKGTATLPVSTHHEHSLPPCRDQFPGSWIRGHRSGEGGSTYVQLE